MYVYRIKNIKPSTCTLLEAAAIDMPTTLKIKSKRPLSRKAIMVKANKYLMEHYGESIDFEDFSQLNEAGPSMGSFERGLDVEELPTRNELEPHSSFGEVNFDDQGITTGVDNSQEAINPVIVKAIRALVDAQSFSKDNPEQYSTVLDIMMHSDTPNEAVRKLCQYFNVSTEKLLGNNNTLDTTEDNSDDDSAVIDDLWQ